MDHLAEGATGAVASHTMAGSAQSNGWVGLIYQGHHVVARVDKHTREFVAGRSHVAWLPGALTLGVRGDKACPVGVSEHGPF